jgi:NSS family neurotransmitter:Na+ symporter
MSRVYASVWIGVLIWLMGLGSIFSFNIWKDKTWSIPYLFKDANFFATLDYLTANIMLPMGGLFIAIFAAWLMRESSSREELATWSPIYRVWLFLTRYIAPVAVLIVFLSAIGVIKL